MLVGDACLDYGLCTLGFLRMLDLSMNAPMLLLNDFRRSSQDQVFCGYRSNLSTLPCKTQVTSGTQERSLFYSQSLGL